MAIAPQARSAKSSGLHLLHQQPHLPAFIAERALEQPTEAAAVDKATNPEELARVRDLRDKVCARWDTLALPAPLLCSAQSDSIRHGLQTCACMCSM